MLVVERDTTGPNQMDPMDESPDRTRRLQPVRRCRPPKLVRERPDAPEEDEVDELLEILAAGDDQEIRDFTEIIAGQ
jgi:hypothetical protein